MSTSELIRGMVSPLRTRRSSASFDGRVLVGSIPTRLYMVRTAADSGGGETRTLASASASSGSSRCSWVTTVAPLHQMTAGLTMAASAGASANAEADKPEGLFPPAALSTARLGLHRRLNHGADAIGERAHV